jgi:hypothetical protein
MPKRTPKQFVFVEPPPTPESSGPGKGVWSDTSGIKVTHNNPRDALREAINNALQRLPPAIAETTSPRALPFEMWPDVWAITQLGLRSSRQTARQWIRRLWASRWGAPLPDESSLPKPVVVGTAELFVEESWRYCPGHQPKNIVRKGILDEFTRELDRQLDADYAHVKTIRARSSPRPNLDRDAMRFVLRSAFGLTNDQIMDYEAKCEVDLDSGHVLVHPGADPDSDSEEFGPTYSEAERRQARNTIDKSIRIFASDAGIPLPPQPAGRRPKIEDPNWEYLA